MVGKTIFQRNVIVFLAKNNKKTKIALGILILSHRDSEWVIDVIEISVLDVDFHDINQEGLQHNLNANN